MSKSAIQLLTLSVCATVLVMGPAVMPASAKTSSHKHTRIHHSHVYGSGVYGGQPYRNSGFSRPRTADHWPATQPYSPASPVCPGIARSFDCKIWPPPIDEDPDRKTSGSDGA